jgi:hypothetical protein
MGETPPGVIAAIGAALVAIPLYMAVDSINRNNMARAEPTAGDLISGALKKSKSYASELADKTVAELEELARKGGEIAQKAKKMLKLIKEGKRLGEKSKG